MVEPNVLFCIETSNNINKNAFIILLQMIVWTVQNILVSIHVWDNLCLNVNNTDNLT